MDLLIGGWFEFHMSNNAFYNLLCCGFTVFLFWGIYKFVKLHK